MSDHDTWICYTCKGVYSLTTDGTPKRDESIENDEGVPVTIHYQCANCVRYATYHQIDSMSFSDQMAYRVSLLYERAIPKHLQNPIVIEAAVKGVMKKQ
jgi:hypothetical protein